MFPLAGRVSEYDALFPRILQVLWAFLAAASEALWALLLQRHRDLSTPNDSPVRRKPWSCLAVGLARWRTCIFTECWGDSAMRCLLYPGIVWLPLIILDPFLGLCESVSTSIYYVNLLKKSSIITGIGEVFASASDKIIMRDATLAHPMLFSSHFHWFWAHCFNYPGQFVQQ